MQSSDLEKCVMRRGKSRDDDVFFWISEDFFERWMGSWERAKIKGEFRKQSEHQRKGASIESGFCSHYIIQSDFTRESFTGSCKTVSLSHLAPLLVCIIYQPES